MSGIEKLCNGVWKMIQLTLIFHLLTICGGIVFGLGPAWQTLINLQTQWDQKDAKRDMKTIFSIWKANFLKANYIFFSFFLLLGFLSYNLYLALQIKEIFFLALTFLLVVAILLSYLLYIYMTFYNCFYEISLWNNAKLSFMSLFLSGKALLTQIILTVAVWGITWQYKGLYLFISFGLLAIMMDKLTKGNRKIVDGKVDAY
ncbi:YesL family protein [Streptococcus catagoni]|uniref:YesL family protein n=1 Tax=Streptococcus catagoni TaxID=2654874 RepID=UPI0014084D2F|nr:DUF624 domain-containing protein [Streptococcus catagoni]